MTLRDPNPHSAILLSSLSSGVRGRNSDNTLIKSKLVGSPPRPIRESARFPRFFEADSAILLSSLSSGVRERNSDNTLIKSKLGWEPATPNTRICTIYAIF
jgi:hypothetical protein